MKSVLCILMIGVLIFAFVFPVFASEVDDPEQITVSDVPDSSSVVGEPENGEEDITDFGDDLSSLDDGEGVSDDGDPSGDGIDEITDSGEIYINADAVYLSSGEDEVSPYAVGDVLSGGAYFDVSTSQLGNVKIYVPIDYQEGSFAYDNHGNIVNIRASTITGYILDGTQYTVRWQSFNAPQYRLVNYSGISSSYNDLTIYSVNDTNIQIVEDDSELPLFPDQRYILLGIFALLGVCCLCLFMKA